MVRANSAGKKRATPKRNSPAKKESSPQKKATSRNQTKITRFSDKYNTIDVTNPLNGRLLLAKPELALLKSFANESFNTINSLARNMKKIRSNNNLSDIEQDWVDYYLQPVIDFMGDDSLWREVYSDKNITVKIGGGYKAADKIDGNIAMFTGEDDMGGHWNGRKSIEEDWFDPYDEFQIRGTNQFCQTFTLMFLLDELPTVIQHIKGSFKFHKYYEYSRAALVFIQNYVRTIINSKIYGNKAYVGNIGKRNLFITFEDLESRVQELIDNYHLVVNCIQVDPQLY